VTGGRYKIDGLVNIQGEEVSGEETLGLVLGKVRKADVKSC